MARLIGPVAGEVTIFKFTSSGIPALIVEAADFIREQQRAGKRVEFIVLESKNDGHYMKFRSINEPY